MAKNAICTWDAVTGAFGYNVYLRVDGGNYEKQNDALITDTSYLLQGLTAGNYDAYVVSSAYNIESDPSIVVSFVVEEAPSMIDFSSIDFNENDFN